MKFEEFEVSLAVSAFAAAFAVMSNAGGGISPPFALCLLALSQAGFFALKELHKAGLATPRAEYLFIGSLAVSFCVAVLSFSGFSYALLLLFIPAVLCANALFLLLKETFIAGE